MGLPMEYNIGFAPEMNQSSWGDPQRSQFGNAVRGGFSPLSGANYEWFPYDPYYWPTNYYGQQMVGINPTEYLYGEYWGFRGILPIGLQNISPEPYPYQLPYPYGDSA